MSLSGSVAVGVLVVSSAAFAQGLLPLPALPTGNAANLVQLSGDGSTLAAINNDVIYRFRSGAWESLANDWTPYPGGETYYQIPQTGVQLSRDGNILTTTSAVRVTDPNSSRQFDNFRVRFYRNNAWTQFGSASTNVSVYAMSADGSRIVGENFPTSVPFVGTWNGTNYNYVFNNTTPVFPVRQLFSPGPSSTDRVLFRAISTDGQTAISEVSGMFGNTTIIRHGQTAAANISRPAGLPAANPLVREFLRPISLSGDGNVIVGQYTNQNDPTVRPFRWSEATGSVLVNLPSPGTSELSSDGNMWVLQNGSVYLHNIADTLTAAQVLTSGGIDINNWSDLRITQLSENGQTLAGFGTFNSPTGIITNTPWVATIPTPGMLAMLAVTALVSSRRKRTNV